jgi:hypothetical protein
MFQSYEVSGFRSSRESNSGFRGVNVLVFQDILGFGVSRFLGIKLFRNQGFEVSRFLGTKIPGF